MSLKAQGYLGVDLFFVISGYLIGGIYFRESERENFSILRFWSRRWLRTIPPYLGLVVIWWVGNRITGAQKTLDWNYLFFFQNYISRPYMGNMPFTWSLCVEEHFYLLLPIALKLVKPKAWGPPAFLAAVMLPTLFRFLEYGQPVMTHMRLDGLVWGVGLSYLMRSQNSVFPRLKQASKRLLPITLLVFPFLHFLLPQPLAFLRITLADLIFASWTLALANEPAIRVARWRVVHWVAITSFSCYLIHGYTFETVRRISSNSSTPFLFLVSVAGVVTTTAGFYYAVEIFTLKLREKVSPRKAHNEAINSNLAA